MPLGQSATRGLPNRESGLRYRVVQRPAVFETASPAYLTEHESRARSAAIAQSAGRGPLGPCQRDEIARQLGFSRSEQLHR